MKMMVAVHFLMY